MALVKMFPAKNGDSFLIRESNSHGAGLILIDGGFESTFRESILPELKSLSQAGAQLDLVVVTHIDADHILGIISLIKANGHSSSPKVIPVRNVWHNSLRSISLTRSKAIPTKTDQAVLSAICASGFSPTEENESHAQEVSGRQGSSLAALLLKGSYRWNGADGQGSITSSMAAPLEITGTMRVHALGPKHERLEALRRSWMKELRRLGVLGAISDSASFDDAFEFMNALAPAEDDLGAVEIAHSKIDDKALTDTYLPDTSANNGSSISVIVETPQVRMLFLGDAWAEDIEEAILSSSAGQSQVVFDAIKISHHGSARNTSPRLLSLIDAPVYFISSDGGKHGHPDLPVLRAIVDRPTNFVRHLHFNYSTPASRELAKYQSKSGALFKVYENSTDWIAIGKNGS